MEARISPADAGLALTGRDGDDAPRMERCSSVDHSGWLALREALWPHCSRDEHLAEMRSFLASPERYVQLVVYGADGLAIGLAEASLRSDYVNGTVGTPVAFLEGLYVVPEARRSGVAARLVAAVCSWAMATGCNELASDTALDNEISQAVHRALGFEETERVVFFRKWLR